MDRFKKIINPVETSTAIRMVMQYIMSNDPNFLRGILGLPTLSEQDLSILLQNDQQQITEPIST